MVKAPIAIIALFLHFTAADANAQNRRGTWWRFAAGGGDANVSADRSGADGWISGGAGAVSGGWTLQNSILIGGEYGLWLKTLAKDPTVDAYMTSLLGTVTWYPWRAWRFDAPIALLFKGGAGMLFRHVDYGDNDTVTIAMGRGPALNAAVGLEFVPESAVSLSMAFDFSYGYMGSAARTDIFPNVHQRVLAVTVGLTIH